MFIETLSFLNIRKTKEAHLKFIPKTNIIIGKNGQGKTTIIEAINLLSSTKSFRKKQNKALTTTGKDTLQVKGEFLFDKKEKKTIKIEITNNKKTIKDNNRIIKKTSDHIQTIPVVYMSPEEENIIEATNSTKSKMFDKIIFKIKKNHIQNIIQYKKILFYRNRLLEEQKDTTAWDEQLIDRGLKVWEEREKFFENFIETYKETQKDIEKKEKYTIEYIKEKIKTREEYSEELSKDKNKEKTKTGPHSDKINFLIEKKGLQEHGSQGEKKTFKLILKLSEANLIKKEKKEKPILMIDDFFAKLDHENIMKTFSYFHRKFQTIITTTNIEKEHETILSQKEEIKTIKCP